MLETHTQQPFTLFISRSAAELAQFAGWMAGELLCKLNNHFEGILSSNTEPAFLSPLESWTPLLATSLLLGHQLLESTTTLLNALVAFRGSFDFSERSRLSHAHTLISSLESEFAVLRKEFGPLRELHLHPPTQTSSSLLSAKSAIVSVSAASNSIQSLDDSSVAHETHKRLVEPDLRCLWSSASDIQVLWEESTPLAPLDELMGTASTQPPELKSISTPKSRTARWFSDAVSSLSSFASEVASNVSKIRDGSLFVIPTTLINMTHRRSSLSEMRQNSRHSQCRYLAFLLNWLTPVRDSRL